MGVVTKKISEMTREEIKAQIKKRLQDGTSEGKEWDELLEALDKKHGGKNTGLKEAASESIAENKKASDKNYKEVDKNLKELQERRAARKAGTSLGKSQQSITERTEDPAKATGDPSKEMAKTNDSQKGTKEKASEARQRAKKKADEKPAPSRKPKTVKPKPAPVVDVLDELPNVFTAQADENAKLKMLEDMGLLPEGSAKIDSPAAQATAKPQGRRTRTPKPSAPVAPPAAPPVQQASRMSALAGKLGPLAGKVGGFAATAGRRLAPVGAALTARELAYMAAPQSAERFEDSLLNTNMTMPAQRFPTADVVGGLQAGANAVKDPTFGYLGTLMNPGAAIGQGINKMMAPRMQAPASPLAQPSRPSFQNDALQQALAQLEPSQEEKSMKPPSVGGANAKIEQVKAESVNPQRTQTAVQKINEAKKKPSTGARTLLKSSPTRQKAQSMFGGLPQSLQDSFAKADQEAIAKLNPQISAPDPSQAPIDFGAEFSKNFFQNPGMTQDRMAWLNERPSTLNVQEQVPQRKPNPLLRALGMLRRPY